VPHPWDTGDLEQNWQGYFVPGTSVLRNRVGARTLSALRDAENDLVEARVIELRESPDLLGDRSYDLAYLRAIHRQLFQDVYVWAGDARTVGIEKGDESFCPPGSITGQWTMSLRKFTASSSSRRFPRKISRALSRICTTTRGREVNAPNETTASTNKDDHSGPLPS
jgi:fido (protein-threonine AMPylation protein)